MNDDEEAVEKLSPEGVVYCAAMRGNAVHARFKVPVDAGPFVEYITGWCDFVVGSLSGEDGEQVDSFVLEVHRVGSLKGMIETREFFDGEFGCDHPCPGVQS